MGIEPCAQCHELLHEMDHAHAFDEVNKKLYHLHPECKLVFKLPKFDGK